MEKIGFLRKVGCSVCESKLASVYVRDKTFKSLEGYYYCSVCDKIYKVDK